MNGEDRFLSDARARGLQVEVRERPDAGSIEEAAAVQGIEVRTIVKTLVVKRGDGTFLFALVPGDRQIAWKKLRAVVGVNRLQLPDSEQALAATGYERGTITPVGSTTAWPVFVDESVVGRRIAMGSGARGRTAWLNADDLITAYDATVADIT